MKKIHGDFQPNLTIRDQILWHFEVLGGRRMKERLVVTNHGAHRRVGCVARIGRDLELRPSAGCGN